MIRILQGLMILFISTASASAAMRPMAGGSDPRIQHLSYIEGEVYELPLSVGVVATIVFDDEASLTSAQIGDSTSWYVERLSTRNILLLKPLEHDGATNMTVTDSSGRLYTFDLRPQSAYAPDPIFRIHFNYPEQDQKRREAATKREVEKSTFQSAIGGYLDVNRNYTYAGSEALRPSRMFDDGTRTYLSFPPGAPRPAIFVVNPDGTERVVEHRTVDSFMVVDLIGRQFTLRDGTAATCLFNKAYSAGEYDALAPAPEPAKPWWFGGRRPTDARSAGERYDR